MFKKLFAALLLSLPVYLSICGASGQDLEGTTLYARKAFEIEAKEKEADVEYWRRRVYLRHDRSRSYSLRKEEDEKISKLKKLRDEFQRLHPPPECKRIHLKFLASKNIRLKTLVNSVNYSARLPLGGMSDAEYKEVFGDWFNYRLSLESESYNNYKEAWAELVKMLPRSFKTPPFSILEYQFKIYEANIKGWLAGQACSGEEEMYGLWHRYLENVAPPPRCAGIHEDFLISDRLKIRSAAEGLSTEERRQLDYLASKMNEKAWLKLSRLISSAY